MKINFKSFFWNVWYFLFFLMLFVPTVFQLLKGVLISIVFIGILGNLRKNNFKSNPFSPIILFLSLLNILAGIFFFGVGFVNNTPGYIRVMTVHLAYPIMYSLFLIPLFNNLIHIKRTLKLLIYISIAVCIYYISFYLNALGILPDSFFITLPLNGISGFYDGIVEISLTTTASIIYFAPLLITLKFTNPKFVNPILLNSALILVIFVSIISGRRALYLIIFISIVFNIGFLFFHGRSSKLKIILSLSGGGIILTFAIGILFFLAKVDVYLFINDFLDVFNSSNPSTFERKLSFDSLIKGWLESPIYGRGFGAAAEYRRSIEFPWAYEITYVALLFQTGILGIFLFAFSTIIVMGKLLFIIVRNPEYYELVLPIWITTFCFLIANNTNPYLFKFDFIWVYFLPIAILNALLIKNGKN